MLVHVLTLVALAGPLQLGDDVRFVDDLDLGRDTTEWTMADGFLFPVRRDEALVGWVAVGDGEQRFRFEAAWQAEAFANAWAVAGTSSPEAVADQAWTEPVGVVLALSADPELSALVADLPEVVRDRKAVGYRDDSGMFNVVVSPYDLDRARRMAREALTERVAALAEVGLDPEAALRMDMVDPGPDRWVVETRTERSWGALGEPGTVLMGPRWLSTVHDPHGGLDAAVSSAVFLLGRGREGAARAQLIATAPRDRDAGIHVEEAQANVMVSLEATGMSLRVEVEQQLTLMAGSDAGVVTLVVPTTAEDAFYGAPPMARGFQGLRVETLDGEVLEPLGGAFAVMPPASTRATEVHVSAYRLPRTLAAGERLTVRLLHVDRWRNSHVLHLVDWAASLARDEIRCPKDPFGTGMLCAPPSEPELVELGRVSAARPVLASIPGRPAHPVELRVGHTMPASWGVAVGGGRSEHREQGGSWVLASADSRALVTVAKDRGAYAYPAMGMPAIEVLGHGPDQPGIPVYLRSILNFYRSVLPQGALAELDLIQASDAPVAAGERDPRGGRPLPRVSAAPGQVLVEGQREMGDAGADSHEHWVRAHAPRVVERGVAGAVAAQYVLDVPVAGRDAWVVEALPAYLRDRFTLEAWGTDVVEVWRELEGRHLEAELVGGVVAPLTPGRPWTELGGARWLSALHARVGERAVMRGLEAFLAGDDRSTEALSAALSKGAGRDVGPWVDFWVRGGVRPSVTARWHTDGLGELHVAIEADTPHGSFEVPLMIEGKRSRTVVWAEVVEGRGVLTMPLSKTATRVLVDPDGLLPLRSRSSERVDERVAEEAAEAPEASQLL